MEKPRQKMAALALRRQLVPVARLRYRCVPAWHPSVTYIKPQIDATGAPPCRTKMITSSTRRDFLALAGMAGATASLVRPSALIAQGAAPQPTAIHIAADAHPAIRSAASILAKKLNLDERSRPDLRRPAEGLARDHRSRLGLRWQDCRHWTSQSRMATPSPTQAGIVVWGARPRSLLFAAGEPHHWLQNRHPRCPTVAIPSSPCATPPGTRTIRSPSRQRSSAQTSSSRIPACLAGAARRCQASSIALPQRSN